AVGCGDRPDAYEAPIPTQVQSFGLEKEVALIDGAANRVLLLTPQADQELARRSIPVGKGIIRVEASADGKRLFVLSTGDVKRKKADDERASLTVIENGEGKRYPLESPHSGFAIDPLGRWIAIFAAPGSGTQANFVENPNE